MCECASVRVREWQWRSGGVVEADECSSKLDDVRAQKRKFKIRISPVFFVFYPSAPGTNSA